MEITAGSSIFLDTNILVYRSIPESPFHLVVSQAVKSSEQQGYPLWISRQVLREYLATLAPVKEPNTRQAKHCSNSVGGIPFASQPRFW